MLSRLSLHLRFGFLFACVCLGAALAATAAESVAAIDRLALVTRHNPHLTKLDPWAPLSVGNGQFCFTADVTGLQTFYDYYQKNGIPLETQARWLWHQTPNPNGYKLADANRPFTAYGKTVGYPTNERSEAGKWLRENPHAMPLPQIALAFKHDDGRPLAPEDVKDIDQTLNLWLGMIDTWFTIDSMPVRVTTACAPTQDLLTVRITSPLLDSGRLAVRIAFPRGHDIRTKNNPALDWSSAETYKTDLRSSDAPRQAAIVFAREDCRYGVTLRWSANAKLSTGVGPHEWRVSPDAPFPANSPSGSPLEFCIGFQRDEPPTWVPADGIAIRAACAAHWYDFWRSGGAVDFSGSTDPRAAELERRVVLSQYLTAIQFAGEFPPSESGLTLSTWYQKHHTEMIWWHAAHFALWGREAFLAKNLDAYVNALPLAREIAKGRELRGARWPKMIGPDWRESPGGNPLIIWNQPHPIHLAELLYRNTPTPETLAHYRELVLETADCMASMLHWDEAKQRYNLGPPLWIAQEIYDQATSMNPTYELSYWIRGLTIAQQWRERLGLKREPEWDKMIKAIAPLPVKGGKYVALESDPDTWENKASRHDHPSFLMAFGQLPGDGVDRAVMGRTLDAVLASWDWETKIWGWDYPMVAMTAARLGEAKKAVDILLFDRGPNNAYSASGHCPQRGDLPVYLPANGALLAAVAMMAGGWDGAPAGNAPGFPRDGTWKVRSEGLRRLP